MKFGIKIWSTNKGLIEIARSHFLRGEIDFIELSAKMGSFDEKIISLIKGIPSIIHCDNTNINFAKKEFYEGNVAAIKEAQKFADFLDAEYIIIHPGYDGDIANVNSLLDESKDKRFCIENMPGITFDTKLPCMGRTYEELKKIKVNNYCLDFNHAIKAAITLGIDPFENIKGLLKFGPILFHVCDGRLDNDYDEHLDIGRGKYDFRRIVDLISEKEGFMSLETPKTDFSSLSNDLINIRKIKRYFE